MPFTDEELPGRINVAIAPETVAALKKVMEQEGWSLTETVRRLTGYGELVYTTIKVDRNTIIIKPRRHWYHLLTGTRPRSRRIRLL